MGAVLLIGVVFLLRLEIGGQRAVVDRSGAEPVTAALARRAVSPAHIIKVATACLILSLLVGAGIGCSYAGSSSRTPSAVSGT